VTFRGTIFTLLAAATIAAPSLRAANHALANYPFPSPTASPRASTDTDLNSTASQFTSGITSTIDNSVGNLAPSVYVAMKDTPNTEPTSSGTSYFEFTLTPNAGQKINLSSLTFDYAETGGFTEHPRTS
jgi:hypothetical protein